MFNADEYTQKAATSVKHAVAAAEKLGHTFVGSEHLISGFLTEGANIACTILRSNGISENKILDYLRNTIGTGIPSFLSEDDITPDLNNILETASCHSRKTGASMTGTEYMLFAVANCNSCGGYRFLKESGADISRIKRECLDSNVMSQPTLYTGISEKQFPCLYKYSKDFTKLAYENKFSPVIGREKEINQIIRILSRKNKNNPCLLGEAGVGKTAVIEGLSKQITDGLVPPSLRYKSICALDIPSMLAGARYRGDFEERIKNCIDEIKRNRNIILFIDEIHTIVGAGAAEGAIDAANILKPDLARGDLQIIGATTYSEYRKFIEKDGALERRFQPVVINEPDKTQLYTILSGIKNSYENYHMVNIPDKIINLTVDLSERYIHDRFLPDKVIDVIDEACSNASLRRSRKANDNIAYEVSESLKKSISDLTSPEEHYAPETYTETVTAEDIAEVISSRTGIPVNSISEDENRLLNNLENELSRSIFGQDRAIKSVSDAIRRNRIGLKDSRKPIGSFLFVGKTGVGKTELAKAIARTLFGSDNNMIRLDMSEYMEQHSISKIIGAPPGYTGFSESGTVSDTIRKNPYSVILFDEIEKAHPDVLNLLLQITDEGEFKDSQGRITNMKNTLIIMTSNTGCNIAEHKNSIGFSDNIMNNDSEIIRKELKKAFKPELLNRIDDIIIFEKLSKDILKMISEMFLNNLSERAEKIGIHLRYTDDVAEFISDNPETERYGARPLRRLITNKIESPLTEQILQKNVVPECDVTIKIDNNKIVMSVGNKDSFLLKS